MFTISRDVPMRILKGEIVKRLCSECNRKEAAFYISIYDPMDYDKNICEDVCNVEHEAYPCVACFLEMIDDAKVSIAQAIINDMRD